MSRQMSLVVIIIIIEKYLMFSSRGVKIAENQAKNRGEKFVAGMRQRFMFMLRNLRP